MNTQTANTTVTDETITYAGVAKQFAKGFVMGAVQVTVAYGLVVGALTIGATFAERLFR
uniref:Uncharacterized protein n=1 Tax=Siphoviridae sp. ctj7g1 TaxID=2826438 RepID=A0A8S5R2J7_9CAUD|nr:MAG TPA: hypothetical protein [Siphoviridae sp. ctj7g1]